MNSMEMRGQWTFKLTVAASGAWRIPLRHYGSQPYEVSLLWRKRRNLILKPKEEKKSKNFS